MTTATIKAHVASMDASKSHFEAVLAEDAEGFTTDGDPLTIPGGETIHIVPKAGCSFPRGDDATRLIGKMVELSQVGSRRERHTDQSVRGIAYAWLAKRGGHPIVR